MRRVASSKTSGGRKQAQHEKRLFWKIEEVAGMNEHTGLVEKPENERFLGLSRRHAHDDGPAAFGREHGERRLSPSDGSQLIEIPAYADRDRVANGTSAFEKT